jgi:hypothetical protein
MDGDLNERALYSPLSQTGTIRVLCFDAVPADEQISCTLRQVDLRDYPRYIALSYAWGDPNERLRIMCDGHELNVTVNLVHALQQLRSSRLPTGLWIDAICIDQSNGEERNQQVSMMHDIFSQVL